MAHVLVALSCPAWGFLKKAFRAAKKGAECEGKDIKLMV
jgi:hypothetical protein